MQLYSRITVGISGDLLQGAHDCVTKNTKEAIMFDVYTHQIHSTNSMQIDRKTDAIDKINFFNNSSYICPTDNIVHHPSNHLHRFYHHLLTNSSKLYAKLSLSTYLSNVEPAPKEISNQFPMVLNLFALSAKKNDSVLSVTQQRNLQEH